MKCLWRIATVGLGIVGLSLALAPDAAMADSTGALNVFLGYKLLDKDDWEPLERQVTYGVEATVGGDTWPVMLAIDTLVSTDDGEIGNLDAEMSTVELDLGVRKVWDRDAKGMIGGGIALIQADVTFEGAPPTIPVIDDDDQGTGIWFGAGVTWTLGSNFNLGASFRWSYAKVDIEGLDQKDAGGWFGGFLMGWGWPGK